MYIPGIDNCPHFFKNKFIDYNALQFFSFRDIFDKAKEDNSNLENKLFTEKQNGQIHEKNNDNSGNFIFESMFKKEIIDNNEKPKKKSENIYYLCLSCEEILNTEEQINCHLKEKSHYIAINLTDISVWCLECKNPLSVGGQKGTPISLIENHICLIKNHIQYLFERKYSTPFHKFYSKEEIYNLKYKKFIENFKEKKYKNIIFMVGAGISTTAGIPDFRSKTGLFQQLQEKYGMTSPEEFFYKRTFLEKPELFYEFCKLFDLSQVKPTLTHKFMKYMIDKGIVKYVFTQNIDGLELKAKIPNEKIIFAHGSFTEGHCPQCKIKVDINKINEGINSGNIVYCDICKGPCKPNVVFYGEALSEEFYKKIDECDDWDLVIIMGTSLQVYPFAIVPELLKNESWKVVFNRDKVGIFRYDYLYSNSLFIQGTTDDLVIKFLKEIDLLDDFKKFIKIEFGDDSIEIPDNVKMMNFEKLDENNNDISIISPISEN